ncbi:MAG: hypothetical protein MRZ79_06225 [Bacteroidia bacterium]|nr:hypothetical protein [Bacteroidia bacterium]
MQKQKDISKYSNPARLKLYYAPGGGLGHLTRGWAFANQNNWNQDEVIFMSARADDLKFEKVLQTGSNSYSFINIPSELHHKSDSLQNWLSSQIIDLGITEVYLDTFPSGMIGEWNDFPDLPINFHLIARNIRLDRYRPFLGNHPTFEKIFEVDGLSSEYATYLNKLKSSIRPWELEYPELKPNPALLEQLLVGQENWLIVHSGSADEVFALLDMVIDDKAHAGIEAEILIIHPNPGIIREVPVVSFFPAYPIFPYVNRIYTAAGFNSMKQAGKFSKKHFALPFPRKYDDQFLRLKLSQKNKTQA